MKQKSKRVRKNIMINLDLVKRARKVFNASSDSQAVELALEQAGERKTDDEVRSATYEFLKHFSKAKIKPLFN